MSKPHLNETIDGHTSLQVDTTGGVLRVAADPGFSSDNGDGCPYRSVLLRGPVLFGRDAPPRTNPDERWPGFFDTRDALAQWRLPLVDGTYTLIVDAGTLFTPWVPGQEGPFIEWNNDDLGQNPSGSPIVNAVTFTVAATVPPPPPPPPSGLDPRLPEIAANTLAELGQARAPFIAWAGANPKEYAQVQAYLAAVADGLSPAPPSLKTHKGRAVVGLLQAAAATVGRLP